MQKSNDNNNSMTIFIQSCMSFEESIKTSCEFKDAKGHQSTTLEAKNKQLQQQLKMTQLKFSELQRGYQALQKQLIQKQQQIEILVDRIHKLNIKFKTQQNRIKNTLLYIQQQTKYEINLRQETITYLSHENFKLRMKLESLSQHQSKVTSQIQQNEFQQQEMVNQIQSLQNNLFNQYIWKLQQLFVIHFKEENRLKAIIFPFFKSIFQQNNSPDNIMSSFQEFLINLVEYQKNFQQKDMIEQYIVNFVTQIEGKNLLQDSQQDSYSISKSRNYEN